VSTQDHLKPLSNEPVLISVEDTPSAYMNDMTPWTEDLENEWFKEITANYPKWECWMAKMGWTENKWNQPIFGKMQADFDASLIANRLTGAENHCKEESDDGEKKDLFMRYKK